MERKKEKEYITVSRLIAERGWTRGMADKLLTNLEYIDVCNPMFKSAPAMRLYKTKDIKRIERTKKYKEMRQKADMRKISAQKAVETKINKTLEFADEFSISVERIDLEDLKIQTVVDKQFWYDAHMNESIFSLRDAYSAPKEDVDRWMVNYIRHNLSNYDDELKKLEGKVGHKKGYTYYKEKLAKEMIRVYPELEQQINMYMLHILDEEN